MSFSEFFKSIETYAWNNGINVLCQNKWGISLRVKPFTEHNGSCVSKPVIYSDQKLHKAT